MNLIMGKIKFLLLLVLLTFLSQSQFIVSAGDCWSRQECSSIFDCSSDEYPLCFEGYCVKVNEDLEDYVLSKYESGRCGSCIGCESGRTAVSGLSTNNNGEQFQINYCRECSSISDCKDGYLCKENFCVAENENEQPETNYICVDTDIENNPFVGGDFYIKNIETGHMPIQIEDMCIDGVLTQASCIVYQFTESEFNDIDFKNSEIIQTTCEFGCNDLMNACLENPPNSEENEPEKFCEDTEEGVNYHKKGVVTTENGETKDYCIDDEILAEYYCENIGGQVGELHECENNEVCEDGACIPRSSDENPISIEVDVSQDMCNGCVSDDNCYPLGYRKSGEYCSEDNSFAVQLESKAQCENNFECESNLCASGECVNQGLLKRILDWFARLFGKN